MYFGNSLMRQDSQPLITTDNRQYSPESEDGDEVTVFQRVLIHSQKPNYSTFLNFLSTENLSKKAISCLVQCYKNWHTHWFIHLLIDWLIEDWFSDWLIDWLSDWSIDWLIDWRLIDWVIDRLIDWLVFDKYFWILLARWIRLCFEQGGMGLTSQLQLQEEDIEMARNRERQVTEVVKSITELNEIFNDLSVMVVEQVIFPSNFILKNSYRAFFFEKMPKMIPFFFLSKSGRRGRPDRLQRGQGRGAGHFRAAAAPESGNVPKKKPKIHVRRRTDRHHSLSRRHSNHRQVVNATRNRRDAESMRRDEKIPTPCWLFFILRESYFLVKTSFRNGSQDLPVDIISYTFSPPSPTIVRA